MKEIEECRLCKGEDLLEVLNLGNQVLTGIFPDSKENEITKGPLVLVWCNHCNLLQLKHRYDPNEMYGENYGYRSGLNSMMVEHLRTKVESLVRLYPLDTDDAVLDIGSNDGTLLKAYQQSDIRRVGVDPTGEKFSEYYCDGITLIPDFFSADTIGSKLSDCKFKIITAISMFYDLEDPIQFVKDISKVLDKEGVWHFEQSYMPSMLRLNSYDTICHEHVEYYSLKPIKMMLEKCGLRIIDVKMNAVNGGSFAVTACHDDASHKSNSPVIEWLLEQEYRMGLHTPAPFREFEKRVFDHRFHLKNLIEKLHRDGKIIHGYGASTKGNVVLQFCGMTEEEIPCIAEINEDKYGKFTPGTNIPIVSDLESKSRNPDYYLVLPWHFKSGILKNENDHLSRGGALIFPFPEIEII